MHWVTGRKIRINRASTRGRPGLVAIGAHRPSASHWVGSEFLAGAANGAAALWKIDRSYHIVVRKATTS
jgi:hypothetical protein